MKTWKNGERDIAKKLTELTGYEFYRTVDSGALATNRKNNLPKTVVDVLTGDITTDWIEWPYTIEVKCYKEINLFSILTSEKPYILDWWEQTKHQAERTGKLPILFFKEDRKQWFVGLNQKPDCKYICVNDLYIISFNQFKDLFNENKSKN